MQQDSVSETVVPRARSRTLVHSVVPLSHLNSKGDWCRMGRKAGITHSNDKHITKSTS